MNLGLPWKLHIPMKVRRAITGRIYGWFDAKVYELYEERDWPAYESHGANTETYSAFKILGKRSYVELQMEIATEMETVAMIFQVALLGWRLTITIEDLQDDDFYEPIFGDSIELTKFKDWMSMPKSGFSSY